MADLHGLIKLRRHHLDEKRRVLGALNAQLTTLNNRKQSLFDKIEKEKELASKDADVARDFGLFLELTKEKIAAVDAAIEQLMVKINEATEEVNEAFRELKKIEITQENRDKAAEKELLRKETIRFDEIGIEGWGRKKKQNKE